MSADGSSATADYAIDAVVAGWRAGGRFGILCTGDAHHAEELFRALSPTADAAFGHAEAVAAETLAPLADATRIVALAWDMDDVEPALLRRCTAILRCGTRTGPEIGALSRQRAARDQDAERAVRMLHAAGVDDHGVDIGAVRLAETLAQSGNPDPLAVVRSVVVEPRRTRTPARVGDSEEGGSADGPDTGDDDAMSPDLARGPGVDEQDGEEQDAEEYQDPPTDAAAEAPDVDDDAGTELGADDESTDHPSEPPDASEPGTATAADVPTSADATAEDDMPSGEDPGADANDAAGRSTAGSTAEAGPAIDVDTADLADETLLLAAPAEGSTGARPATDFKDMRTGGRSRRSTRHLRGRQGPQSPSIDRGHAGRIVPPERTGGRIAIVPTLHRAARRRACAYDRPVDEVPALTRDDLRGALRRRRGGMHTVIVVDGSSSLGKDGIARAGSALDQAMAAVTARRGVMSVVVAAGAHARVVVDRSTSLARARLSIAAVEAGGGTPLAGGVRLAIELLAEDDLARRRVLLLTDGRANVGLDGRNLPPARAAAELAAVLTDLTAEVPNAALVPIGIPAGPRFARDTAPFVAAGIRVLDP